jgi:flagellar protein FliO/FliZ
MAPLLWLVGVVALIPLLLWLLRRSPMGGQFAAGPVRPVGTLALSTSQRLVTIEVGQGDERLWLVLGVTPNSISTLHTMAPQAAATAVGGAGPGTNPQASFAQLLQRLQGRGPNAR